MASQELQQMQIEESDDEEYEPTEQEIVGYAEFLGMDLEEDHDLLYIAEEGLKAPVPEPWKAFSNEQEEIYYTNTITGQVIFDHPLDEVYRKKFQDAKMRKMRGENSGGLNPASSNNANGANNSQIQQQQTPGGSFAAGPVFGAKRDDVLIKAATEKKVNEQKGAIEAQYLQGIDEIDKHFELRKKELIMQNQQEIEREKDKWDQFKRQEEKKIRSQAETDADSKLRSFKDKLRIEEEKEMQMIRTNAEQRLANFERELDQKLEAEKLQLAGSYERIRRTVEESERERYEFELEKFKNEQNKQLDGKRGDIERLKTEKRKVQSEYNLELDNLKRDFERKLEKEKREMQEETNRNILQVEKQEERKYEQQLTQLKHEIEMENKNSGSMVSHQVQDYKQELEAEAQRVLREHQKEQQKLIRKEEDRLDEERQLELQEYENALVEQYEADLKRKSQKITLLRENEERELELAKLRIDQNHQEQLEAHRRACSQRFEKERRTFDEEKRRRMQDIQLSIEKLNITSSDKEKLREQVESLNRQQRTLKSRLNELETELEDERSRKRAAERELNELNLQISQNRISNTGNQQEAQRISFLREEIAKKSVQISAVQREYRAALEERTENAISGTAALPTSIYQQSSPPPLSAAANNNNIYRLEQEMTEIKAMLNEYGHKNKQQNAERISDMIAQIDDEEPSNFGGAGLSRDNFDDQDDMHNEEWVRRQKIEIKELQKMLEVSKKEFKQSQAEVESLRLEDPTIYRKKQVVLEKVKVQLEKKIEKMNQRISKVKEVEARLR